jgi:hypothetical protein
MTQDIEKLKESLTKMGKNIENLKPIIDNIRYRRKELCGYLKEMIILQKIVLENLKCSMHI